MKGLLALIAFSALIPYSSHADSKGKETFLQKHFSNPHTKESFQDFKIRYLKLSKLQRFNEGTAQFNNMLISCSTGLALGAAAYPASYLAGPVIQLGDHVLGGVTHPDTYLPEHTPWLGVGLLAPAIDVIPYLYCKQTKKCYVENPVKTFKHFHEFPKQILMNMTVDKRSLCQRSLEKVNYINEKSMGGNKNKVARNHSGRSPGKLVHDDDSRINRKAAGSKRQ